MSVSLVWTVQKVLDSALADLNIIDADGDVYTRAHNRMNQLLGTWSADKDMMITGLIPVYGYTDLTDTVALPPEYINALITTLAMSLAPSHGVPVSAEMKMLSDNAIAIIKDNNIQRISGSINPTVLPR